MAVTIHNGVIVVSDGPEPSSIAELEAWVATLDRYRLLLTRWREQGERLSDCKLYLKCDGEFVEVVRETKECLFVSVTLGESHCLSAIRLNSLGRHTRRNGTRVHSYWQGWRARQEVASWIENAEEQCATLMRHVIPGLIRVARQSNIPISPNLVQRLRSHYSRTFSTDAGTP